MLYILKDLGTPCLIHQPRYSIFDRWVEDGLLDALDEAGVGSIVFSPLAQEMLTNKYLKSIPADSRAADKNSPFLQADGVEAHLPKIKALNEIAIAIARGQTLAQMAVNWVLKRKTVTTALIGASCCEQVTDILGCLEAAPFSDEELSAIDAACEL